jgi:Ser/Thr protein kinase RdoA (MazF antagonist)
MTSTGEVIVKQHRSPERHRQELHAYQRWTPALGDHAPRLLAASEDPPVIVLTAIPGTPLTEAHLTPVQLADAYRQGGELLRRLHQAAPPRTEPDMTQWLAGRGERWLALATDLLPARQRAEIRDHLKALEQLGPIAAVPCHLDYTPRNLLATTTAEIAVIDFEHSRYDLAARDLARLATRVWVSHPNLEDAFLHGYGTIGDLDRQVIKHCSQLDTLTAVVRAAGRAP